MATLVELESRVRDLNLRVRVMEQAQADNLTFDRAILARVDARTEDLQMELAAVRAEMDAGFAAVRSEMDAGFAALRSDTEAGFTAVQSELVATQANIAVLRSDIAEIKDILKGGGSGTGG